MALTKSTVKVTNISELSTKPNATDGLTDTTFKALFDKSSFDNKTYINDVLTPEIDAAISGFVTSDAVDAIVAEAIVGKQKVITNGTAEPTGGVDGDIYIQYVA